MAKKKRKRIASRGSVNNIILKTLINGDKYGYEIIKEVEQYSEGKIKLKQPSLYSSLTRFEEKGFVSSYWGDSDIGGRRHYYHITTKGTDYYQKEILKIGIEYNKTDNDNTEINNENISTNDTILETNDTLIIEEVDENSIPATLNFEVKNNGEEEIIADHNFHNITPIEQYSHSINYSNAQIQANESEIKDDKSNQVINTNLTWLNLINTTKNNNKKCANSPFKRLHYIKPKKSKMVILDSDGIYKLRDADYIPQKKNINKPKIIDNVGKRINNENFGFNSTTPKDKHPNGINLDEMSDEERIKRNANFLERFNEISKSKMKEPQPKVIQIQESKIEEKEIDYRTKLDIMLDNSQNDSEYTNDSQERDENNLFNYKNDSNEDSFVEFEQQNYDDDKFVNFEPIEFETKADNKHYIEEISNFNADSQEIKISRYENKSRAILPDKQFVKINKVRCLFGFVLLILCLIELSISYLILKGNNLIFEGDNIIIILSYVVSLIVSIGFIIPILFNPNKHKLNNYILKYSMIFGILTFLVITVLIYCINALIGFELDNFTYFAVKIILPTILAFNFVITPPIYSIIIKSKRFYD